MKINIFPVKLEIQVKEICFLSSFIFREMWPCVVTVHVYKK